MPEQNVSQIGFRVIREIGRPTPSLVEELSQIPTPDLADAMYGSGAMIGEIRAAYRPMPRIAGPAVTVSLPTGSFPMLKMGMQQTQAGDVLVVSTRGAMSYAMWGGNVSVAMAHRGLKGIVIDGYARDVGDAQEAGFPIFCRGAVANSPPMQGQGEVNVPIACGGVVVNPGDIIVADEDGVVAVPQSAAREIIRRARDQQERYAALRPIMLRGEVTNIENIEREVRDQGCQIL
jgi:4-hydroxy-4-methyl-2-oxoglutarate aldolase